MSATTARDRLDGVAVTLLVIFCAIWGTQQAAIKIAAAAVPPVMQAGIRSIGATVLVAAWARLRGIALFERDATGRAGLLAGLLFAGEFGLIFTGLQFTTAMRGVIFVYTAPFFVALGASRWLPAERMRRAQWIGMGLAFLGIVGLFGENLLHPSGRAWIGDLMMFGAAAFWAATTLVVKATPLARATPEKTLLYQLAVSALALPVLSAVLGEPGVGPITPTIVLSMVFQVVVVASTSYLGWFWLIRHYPATRLSSFSFLTPVFGVIAGGLILGERLTSGVAFALALVALGIWVANRRP